MEARLKRGERVHLNGLDIPLTVSWFWRTHEDTGQRDPHFVVATEALSGRYLVRLGKRRWQIEACFKTLKHTFGWDCFGQGTRLGMYRWWLLAFISYLLGYGQFLTSGKAKLDGQAAARTARRQFFPKKVWPAFSRSSNRCDRSWPHWDGRFTSLPYLLQHETETRLLQDLSYSGVWTDVVRSFVLIWSP